MGRIGQIVAEHRSVVPRSMRIHERQVLSQATPERVVLRREDREKGTTGGSSRVSRGEPLFHSRRGRGYPGQTFSGLRGRDHGKDEPRSRGRKPDQVERVLLRLLSPGPGSMEHASLLKSRLFSRRSGVFKENGLEVRGGVEHFPDQGPRGVSVLGRGSAYSFVHARSRGRTDRRRTGGGNRLGSGRGPVRVGRDGPREEVRKPDHGDQGRPGL